MRGKRIKKETATEYVVFVYDGFGKLIGEYSTDGPSQDPMVHYTATDPLGSPRVLTNENGAIISRRDFMPFGEEIASDTNHRSATHKYGVGDNVRQKFTGYEHDEETGLDFAEARYYYNNHGRFTAVDPLLASGKSANPQTFNRYAYVMNRPLTLVDLSGLQCGTPPKQQPTVQKPPTKEQVQVTGTSEDTRREGYHLVITGYTPFAINKGVATDDNGNVIKDLPIKTTANTNGFGIMVIYELRAGGFPAPDKNAETTVEEQVEGTLDGEPAKGEVADTPIEARTVDGKTVIQDLVGIKSETPEGPSQVRESTQTISLSTTINGIKETISPIRTNKIVINPNDKVKIKITDTTPKDDEDIRYNR